MTRSDHTLGIVLLLSLTPLPISPHTALASSEAAAVTFPASVYVSENGSCYHHADCPRLRFAQAMPLSRAELTYEPCPVCILPGGFRPAPARAAVVPERVADTPVETIRPRPAETGAGAVAAAPRPRAARETHEVRKTRGRGAHAALGLLVGAGVGFALGYGAGSDDQWFFTRTEGAAITAALGAGLGAVVGALLPVRTERALERGREAARVAATRVDEARIAAEVHIPATPPPPAEVQTSRVTTAEAR